MGIKFLNRDSTLTTKQIGTIRSTRPLGYKFPVGISVVGTVAPQSVEVVAVAGGGGGSVGVSGQASQGGGGGGGGVIYISSYAVVGAQSVPVFVGAGGPTAPNSLNGSSPGANSSFGVLVAVGGGGTHEFPFAGS